MSKSGLFAVKASHLGKSARSRARLIDAALAVFARQGLEAASINEIAREADMANGTFYLHFKDKDELTSVVALSVADEIVRQLDAAMADIDDAAERVSLGTRQFIHIAFERPNWGWAFARAFWVLPRLRIEVGRYMRQDIERGVAHGAFPVTVDDFVIEMVGSLVSSALFARMNGTVGPEAGSRAAELQLRLLGVDPDRAKALAWRSLDQSLIEVPIWEA
ncbi:TetR/AcrR family transcriptional regulator [Sphingorhabdus sp.]|jgi:AcrR family transcriptional regulator|uniref:TetR/AcrR family transcriptional regulator n=1 Tax=Sphingorhabdus sp. TaxID=1902408 RepID=UPI0040541C2C